MKQISTLTITEIQQALNLGELSAQEIALHTLDTISAANPAINAYTHITADRMLSEAYRLDTLRTKGQALPALAAIPYAVKNLFDVAGETTLAGASLFCERAPARQDAPVISRLAQQGAMLSGMLNMDAYAYGFTTENSHYGATRNPRDVNRIAGGSSGGSAAAVAAGLVN
ncbi:amidase family protein, partial [Yersinia enterocolitica]